MTIRKSSLLFYLLVLILGLVFFITSFTHDEIEDWLLPRMSALVVILLTVFLIIGEAFFSKLMSKFQADVLNLDKREAAVQTQPREADKQTGLKAVLFMLLWLLGFFLLTVIIGLPLAIFVSVGSFMKTYAKSPWIRAMLVAGATSGGLYLIFAVLFDFRLFPGILFGGIIV